MASATAHPNHQLISSEDVEGVNVYDMQGKKIGEIDHLMIDKISGRVTYAVMSFGGFLGLGHSHYPVPWGALKYSTKLSGYETSMSERTVEGRTRVQRRFLYRPELGDQDAHALQRPPLLVRAGASALGVRRPVRWTPSLKSASFGPIYRSYWPAFQLCVTCHARSARLHPASPRCPRR